DRICLMDEGRVMQTGTPKELLFQPDNEFVRSFLDNHRLQLEMMSITVSDIVEHLAESDLGIHVSNKENTKIVDRSTSLFRILEQSDTGREDQFFRISDSNKKILGVIRTDRLLEAFRNLRFKFREGKNG
ncbi:MAG: hypothetical protein ACNS64_10325, partial [Candidatus Halalkalibacterium sp. M3_1C_030]